MKGIFALLLLLTSCSKWVDAGNPQSMTKCSIDARRYEEGAINEVAVIGAMDSLCKSHGKDRGTGRARCNVIEKIGEANIKGVVQIECK